jgi:hypothetical protein
MSTADLIFEHPRALVYHGRWQDIGLQPGMVSVVLTDPPFTGHVHENVRSCNTTGLVKVTEYDINFDALESYEHVPALLGLASRWVIMFCALEQLGDYRRAAGGDRKQGKHESSADYRARLAGYVRSGIWRKQQAAPQLSGDRPANSCEGWAVMHPKGGKMAWNGGGKHAYLSSHEEDAKAPFYVPDFVEEGRERAKKRHAAQKPDALCDKLAEWFVNADDVVLDGYCGSGALGMAALRRGATVIFADTDPEWAVFTADRVAAYLAEIDRTLTAPPSRGMLST